MAFVLVVATTHYIIIYNESKDMRDNISDKATSVGVTMLYKMISNIYSNVSIFPLKPQYILSTDDTVLYMFEGKEKKEEKIR